MVKVAKKSERVFKTAWFTKAAHKATFRMRNFAQPFGGWCLARGDDLGGGVFKARLRKNQYGSIILERAGHSWVYEYLFAKQDWANIAADELANFRKLVKVYAVPTTVLRYRPCHLKPCHSLLRLPGTVFNRAVCRLYGRVDCSTLRR